MAYKIMLISNVIKSGKTTIAFNLATILAKKNKKVLLINQEYNPSYWELLPLQNKTSMKNVISPFVMIKYDKQLSILLFSNGKINPNKYDYIKLFHKQIQLLENEFDYIIIDTSFVWEKLIDIALANSHEIIAIYDSNNFASNQLQKILTLIRKSQNEKQHLKLSTLILNNYNPSVHLSSLLEVTKMMGSNYLFVTLPYRMELQKISEKSIKFVRHNQWDDYTIMLNKVVNQILKNT